MPATTSSPCAFGSHSPKNMSSPVAGLRVKATPVAELFPVLPKTIDWTFTAVPHSSGIFSILRYDTARFPIHDWNTAPMPPHSCSLWSSGNSFLSVSLMIILNSSQSLFRSSTVISVSFLYPFSFFTLSIACSSLTRMPSPSGSMPAAAFSMTTSEYIMSRRR